MNNLAKAFDFEGYNVEVLVYEGKVLFNPKHIGNILEMESSTVRKAIGKMNQKQIIKLKNSDVKDIHIRKLNNAGENFITESGVLQLILRSNKPEAIKLKDWITDEVIPSISQKGKYDLVEKKIEQVAKDEKEKTLMLTIKNFEDSLRMNPTDMMIAIMLSNKKIELEQYRLQLKQKQTENLVNKVSQDVEIIKKQNTYICNRTNFNEKVRILANKYFGRDVKLTYEYLYSKMKTLGSFDVKKRQIIEWDKMNLEREESGKKPYAKSTLKQKCTCLDIIEKYDKWDLCNESYKALELENIN